MLKRSLVVLAVAGVCVLAAPVCERGGAHVPGGVSGSDHRAGGRNQARAGLPANARGAGGGPQEC